MSGPCGHTVIRLVIGLGPHQRSLATSATAPPSRIDWILYGPDDGKRFTTSSALRPGLMSHVVFHSFAICCTTCALLLSSAAVTSTFSWSAMTCDGIIEVAANSWV